MDKTRLSAYIRKRKQYTDLAYKDLEPYILKKEVWSAMHSIKNRESVRHYFLAQELNNLIKIEENA